ncbi:TA system antitoxin ParD family protein [Gordonia sp. DT30]|uniref:TA system antitoxin ParD family protein n=1 Tax=unclassified Gordonia (in: high G+C Gram-positive bacteria) TaxID=2657482 RepID=UPI003CF6A7C7
MADGTADKVTRFSAALVDAAGAEGAREHRSARQQLEHWARVGRGVSLRTSAARRRVESALTGSLPIGDLTPEESVVFDAEVEALLEERLAMTDIVAERAAQGFSSVAVGDDGRMVEYRADGTTVVLE